MAAPAPGSQGGLKTPAQITAIANAANASSGKILPGRMYDGTPVQAGGLPTFGGSTSAGIPYDGAPTDRPTVTTGAGSVPDGTGDAEAKAQNDAYARLLSVLQEYGLENLSGPVRQWLVEGLSDDEIAQRVRTTDEFKARFPAIEERKKKGLAPISPAEYIAYERQARQTFRAAGLPQGFYDGNDDFTKFLGGDVSIAELTDRVGLASSAAFNADPSVRSALSQFGLTGGDLTAFFLDPDTAQPLLERKYNAARLSAAGSRTGFGFLTESESNSLLQSGVTESAATAGLSDLAYSSELYGSMDGGEDRIGRDEQLGATFQGDARAKRRIQQRAARRSAVFQQGGSFAAGNAGISGLGASQT